MRLDEDFLVLTLVIKGSIFCVYSVNSIFLSNKSKIYECLL